MTTKRTMTVNASIAMIIYDGSDGCCGSGAYGHGVFRMTKNTFQSARRTTDAEEKEEVII